jgi:hypothetical protein
MEGNENPRKVRGPSWGGVAGSEGGFEMAMEPFNHILGLRVKESGRNVGHVEERGKVGPKRGN